jgi:membrane protein YqaA with SNARE-associated domain
MEADATKRTRYRRLAVGATLAALAGAGVVAVWLPGFRSLAVYFLYAIPAHLLVSFLANEPALLAAAKSAPPLPVAVAGTAGCIVAILLDYALIGWFVNHRLIRTELNDSRTFRFALRFFSKAPFVQIILSALLPVPFYPVKILAIACDYSQARFIVAMVLGRFPRFYLLALGGHTVQAPDSALLSAGVALALISGWGLWRTIQRRPSPRL